MTRDRYGVPLSHPLCKLAARSAGEWHDQELAGQVVRVHVDLGLEHGCEIGVGEDLGRLARGGHPAVTEQVDPVAVLGGQVQIVQ